MEFANKWSEGYVGAFEAAGATMKDQYSYIGWSDDGTLIHSAQIDHINHRKNHDYRPEEGTYRFSVHPKEFQDLSPLTVKHVREAISAFEKAYLNNTPVQLILRKGGRHSIGKEQGMCKWLNEEKWKVTRIDRCEIYIDVYLARIQPASGRH